MESLKKWIIIIAIIFVVISIILVLLYIKNQNTGTDYEIDSEFEKDTSHVELNSEFELVKNKNIYYAVKNVIGKYAYSIIDGGKDTIYAMLEKNFVIENSIEKANVLVNVDNINVENLTEDQFNKLKIDVNIDEMYSEDITVNISCYYVKGEFLLNVNSKTIDFQLLVLLDTNNTTFYIYPSNYISKKYKTIESLSEYQYSEEEIPDNNYNKFTFTNIDDAQIVNDYLSKFKNLILKDIEKSYEMIDEEYRENKFQNLEKYKEYIEENENRILSITFEKYKTEKEDNFNKYICLDSKGNYCIFKETAIMDFTVLLDDYTVLSEEFINKYDESSDEIRVGLNVNKVMQAINIKDYDYIYSKLDENFKANNFDNIDKFKEFMRSKFPDCYEAEFISIEKVGDTFVQNIKLKSISSNTEMSQNIIMQLKDNYEFVMSFSTE